MDIFLCWLSCADSGRGHHYLIYLLFISRKMPCHSKLAIVGDSHCFRLTKQWMLALPPHITGVSVRAFGYPGAKLGGTTFCEKFIHEIYEYQPTHVFIWIGCNDLEQDLRNRREPLKAYQP